MINFSEEDNKKEKYQREPSTSSIQKNNSDSDEEITKAYRESLQEHSILPILKHELRLKIQTRRLSEGREELKPEKTEPKVYELTEEEKEKYKRRLEQNRESLRRARNKEIEHEKELKMTYDQETSKCKTLKRQKEVLLREKETIKIKLLKRGLEFNENTSTFKCVKCKMTISYPAR